MVDIEQTKGENLPAFFVEAHVWTEQVKLGFKFDPAKKDRETVSQASGAPINLRSLRPIECGYGTA